MVLSFCAKPEISQINPQTRYFLRNADFGIFKYGHIWRGDLENCFLRKSDLSMGAWLFLKLVKSIMRISPRNFQPIICDIDWSGQKSKFSINPKIWAISKIWIRLSSANMALISNSKQSGRHNEVSNQTPNKNCENNRSEKIAYISLLILNKKSVNISKEI